MRVSAATEIKEIRDRQDEITITLSNYDRNPTDQRILENIKVLHAEYDDLKEKLPELEYRRTKEEEEDRSINSVSPSQLHAGNLERARGAFRIHDRDSGIARHSLFYEVVLYLNDSENSQLKNLSKMSELSKVPEDKWKKLAMSIDALARKTRLYSNESREIRGREAYYSEGLARCLTNFSSHNGLAFLFSHQLACKATTHKEDTVDVAAFYTNNVRDYLLGLLEVEMLPDDKTKWQLCGYLSEAFESKLLDREQRVSFGLTIDQYEINLYGFRWDKHESGILLEHSLLWKAYLSEATKDGGKIFKAYFLCLAALSNPVVRDATPSNDYCPLVDDGVIYNSPKVFHDRSKTIMYKLFDYGKYRTATRQPNQNIIKAAYSKNGNRPIDVDLKEDKFGMVSVLTTPWFHGNHKPTHYEHIAKVCDQLQLLHDKGMHHNDVLCQNIIFGWDDKSKPTANLIDFDYAHLEVYPLLWNSRFRERHPKSREGKGTHASHDVYAVIAILCNYFKRSNGEQSLSAEFADGEFTKDEHPQLKPEWEHASAATVGLWVRKNGESLVLKSQSTHERTPNRFTA